MSIDNLKHKAISGIIWSALQKYSTMLISFISGIILARLLTPSHYGCIGMLEIFMVLAQVFIDAGFGSALIQKKNTTQTDYSTVFFFNLCMAAILYTLLYIGAPHIANFYHMPILSKILRIQGIILFIYSLNIIQQNQIKKNLQFKKLSKIMITTSLSSLIITVFLAYTGCGVWALVVQNFTIASIPCIFFWITTKWRPTLEFSIKSFKELFAFGSFMFFTHLFEAFSQKISGLLIGRFFSPATMGYYSLADSTANTASLSVSGAMVSTTFPLYSSVQDDKERLSNIVRRVVTTLAYITYPILCTLIIIAKPLFIIVFSEKWIPAVPYFQILCIAGLAICLMAVNYQSIAAIGKSKVRFKWTLINQSVGLILQLFGMLYFGIKGLMFALVIAAWFSYLVNITLVSKYVGYKNHQQIRDIIPILIISVITALLSYYVTSFMELNMYVDVIIKVMFVVAVYIGWSLTFKPEAYVYTLSIIKTLKNKL